MQLDELQLKEGGEMSLEKKQTYIMKKVLVIFVAVNSFLIGSFTDNTYGASEELKKTKCDKILRDAKDTKNLYELILSCELDPEEDEAAFASVEEFDVSNDFDPNGPGIITGTDLTLSSVSDGPGSDDPILPGAGNLHARRRWNAAHPHDSNVEKRRRWAIAHQDDIDPLSSASMRSDLQVQAGVVQRGSSEARLEVRQTR
ncbi:MAG: hypothetical protein Q7S13_01390 [Candidatus Omnitrophota bacterium]|nr:hypothetical protein [Candidatus Omnitrophota bacterium]